MSDEDLNRTYVLYNLEEAHEEIGLIIRDLKRDPAYSEKQLERALRHVVHHVNIAWNARRARVDRFVQRLARQDVSCRARTCRRPRDRRRSS